MLSLNGYKTWIFLAVEDELFRSSYLWFG